MLKRIKIAHYKSISELDLSLGPRNVIVGPNGSGKSNLIDCLSFIKDAALDDLDSASTKRHGVNSIRQWSKTRPYNIGIECYFEKGQESATYKLVLSSARDSFKVIEETGTSVNLTFEMRDDKHVQILQTASFTRNEDGDVVISSDNYAYTGPIVSIRSDELFLSQLSVNLSTFYSYVFATLVSEINSFSVYAIYPNTIRQPQVVTKSEQLAPDGSNLASILKRLNSGAKTNKDRLIDALKVVLPIVRDYKVQAAGGFHVPQIRVREPTGDMHFLNMSQISDGTLRMLGLLAAFYQPEAPHMIALEEPEQMIHPGLLPVLRDAAMDYLDMVPDSQVFITTHSPNLVDLFAPEDIIWVNFKNGISEAGRISNRQLALIHDQLFSTGEILVSEGFAS